MKLWIVVCGDQDDAAGRELDDLVVTRGNDDTDLNLQTWIKLFFKVSFFPVPALPVPGT